MGEGVEEERGGRDADEGVGVGRESLDEEEEEGENV